MSNKSIPAIFVGGPCDKEQRHIRRDDLDYLEFAVRCPRDIHNFPPGVPVNDRPNYKITTYTRRNFRVDEVDFVIFAPKGVSDLETIRKILEAYVS